MKINYTDSNTLDKSSQIIKINDYDIEIINLNGIIYRSDQHTMDMLRSSPACFGDYNSAFAYLYPNSYLKTYETKIPLKLFSLNKDHDNKIRLAKFFKGFLFNEPQYKNDILPKILYVILQISHGIVVKSLKDIDLCGLTINEIENYLLNAKTDNPKNKLVIDDTNKIKHIINDVSKMDNIIPSRVSLKNLDKFIMTSLKTLLVPYKLDGTYYLEELMSKEDEKKTLCYYINKEYFKKESTGLTCVPKEIVIFDPSNTLKITKIQQEVNKTIIEKPLEIIMDRNKMDRNKYKNEYHKYKNKYHKYKNKYAKK